MDPTPGRPGWGFWGRLTPRPSPLIPQPRDLEVPSLAPPALASPLWVKTAGFDPAPRRLWARSPGLALVTLSNSPEPNLFIVSFPASRSPELDPGLATGYSHGDSEYTVVPYEKGRSDSQQETAVSCWARPSHPILGSSASRRSLLGVQMGARRGPKSMGHSPLRPLSGTGRSCPEARPSLSSLITNWAPSRPCLLSAARCPWRPGVGMCQAVHMLGGGAPLALQEPECLALPLLTSPTPPSGSASGAKDRGTQFSLGDPSGKQRAGCSGKPNPLSVESTPGPSGSGHSSTQSANPMGLSHPWSCPRPARDPGRGEGALFGSCKMVS